MYEESIAETPYFDGDSAEEKRRREISYLNITWFMTNLLDRKDRMSMASGVEIRVPFADHRIFEFVYKLSGFFVKKPLQSWRECAIIVPLKPCVPAWKILKGVFSHDRHYIYKTR